LSYWSDYKFVDTTEIESRFSNEDYFEFMMNILPEELSEESKIQLDRIKNMMEYLPKIEKDFFNLYFFLHKSQTDISKIFSVSQPTVCYRLKKAKERIKYVLSLPTLSNEDIRTALNDVLSDPEDVEIMVFMFETTCQSEVAKRMGTSQGKVRHRFLRSIKEMKKFEELSGLTEVFEKIENNLTILKEVSRKTKPSEEYYVD
jgi:DNA-directed RNA polymerase specialized sigma subunit